MGVPSRVDRDQEEEDEEGEEAEEATADSEQTATFIGWALGEQRYGLAHWAAAASESSAGRRDTFAAAAYADAMRTATGECAAAYRDLAASIDLDVLEGDRTAQLVALAAGLRAALLAPFSGAADVLMSLRPAFSDSSRGGDHGGRHRLRAAWAATRRRHHAGLSGHHGG